MNSKTDLTILIPSLNEAENLKILIPELEKELVLINISYEILIVTHNADKETLLLEKHNVRVIEQEERGYGGALIKGFEVSRGEFIVTMDADLSHKPVFIGQLWGMRDEAEIVIASRYVKGGKAEMPLTRYLLSRILNLFFMRGLSLPIRDLSSGYRLYKSSLLKDKDFKARDFDILQEIIVRLYSEGWRVREVPFSYRPRKHGASNARIFAFGVAYLKTFFPLRSLRNSMQSAEHDVRIHTEPSSLRGTGRDSGNSQNL